MEIPVEWDYKINAPFPRIYMDKADELRPTASVLFF
jgi:hypothetical protein